MKSFMMATLLALPLGAQDFTPAPGPVYGATVNLDDVWGPACIEIIEQALRRLDGVKTAKAQGFRAPEKFFFDVEMAESASLLPPQMEALAKKLEDYPFLGMWYREIPGTVGPAGTFTARGSGQKFDLVAGEGLKALPEAGGTPVALSGKVTQAKGALPKIEVVEVKVLK